MNGNRLSMLGFAVLAAFWSAAASAADSVAFIANLKGEVALDGAARPPLLAELGKGQKLSVSKDATLSVMYIQSGKEFVLKGPGEYVVGDADIAAAKGSAPAARQTEWRTNSKVLVQVAQTSAASIRMRGIPPPEAPRTNVLLYPAKGGIAALQPMFRWQTDAQPPYEFTLSTDNAPIHKAKATGMAYKPTTRLKPGTDYLWTVTAQGREIGSGAFHTLAADDIARLDKRRPRRDAEFSDRLMYALLLQETGATDDAQEAWAALAKERSDLPELARLTRTAAK